MRIGILGGGQLGRMLALAGYDLGFRFRFLDPNPDCAAGQVGELLVGSYHDQDLLADFVGGVEVVTFEFENVPRDTVSRIAERVPVFPPPGSLETAQDRLKEKRFFTARGIPTAAFHAVENSEDLAEGMQKIGAPAILKTRRLGYDGKGQAVVRSVDEAEAAWNVIGCTPSILESFVPFEREISVIGVRARDGSMAFYPLVENRHVGGILSESRAPAPGTTPEFVHQAQDYAREVLEGLEHVGVLALECFEVGGKLLANEIAPRVHNSGHWTIEGGVCSQFENHLRAISGFATGSTAARGVSLMINLIGDLPSRTKVLRYPGVHYHNYGKKFAPRRKLGHLTVCGDSWPEVEKIGRELRLLVSTPGEGTNSR